MASKLRISKTRQIKERVNLTQSCKNEGISSYLEILHPLPDINFFPLKTMLKLPKS